MDKLAAIVGPTASGKTGIAIKVAQRINAEIISCDSMQIYRGMDIGTAKASPEERKAVPHYMIDIVEPGEDYSVARYQEQCKELIRDINRRGKIPMLVGGTGLYYQAVVDNYTFIPMESRFAIRDKWKDIISTKGLPFAYGYLQTVDPDYAAIIAGEDEKRIVRALEVYELTGKPFSLMQNKQTGLYKLSVVGLYLERSKLYQRINTRVDDMIARGLVDEVRALRKKGYDLSLNSMQALGYRQVIYYLDGLYTWDKMADTIKKESRRYAKRQLTWFRRDPRINWIDTTNYSNEEDLNEKIVKLIEVDLSVV